MILSENGEELNNMVGEEFNKYGMEINLIKLNISWCMEGKEITKMARMQKEA